MVKEFHSLNSSIDKQINKFIQSNKVKIVDIKLSTILDMHGLHRIALIVYEE